MLLVVLAAAVMLAVTEAATTDAPPEPARCCFDKEFSAVLGELGGMFNPATGDLEYIDGVAQIGFDFYRKRFGRINTLRRPSGSFSTRLLIRDFANKMQYVREGNGTCSSTAITRGQLYPPCIPDNATFVGTATFGYGANTLSVNTWEFMGPSASATIDNTRRIRLAVSKDHCIPIVETILITFGGSMTELNIFFTGYHPGLQDLSFLNPPDDCRREAPAGPILGRRSV